LRPDPPPASLSARAGASGRPLWLWLAARFVLAGVLPLLLVGALLLVVYLPQARVDIDNRQQVLAGAISGQVELHLLGAERELSTIAAHLRRQDGQPPPSSSSSSSSSSSPSPSSWPDVLGAHLADGDVFTAIYVADADDVVHAVGLADGQGGQRRHLSSTDPALNAVMRAARARGAAAWSEVPSASTGDRAAAVLAIPLGDAILLGEVSIDRLGELLARLPNAAGMATMIVDRRGQFVAGAQPGSGARLREFAPLPGVSDGQPGLPATREFVADGERFIGTLAGVSQLGWSVLVVQERSEALEPFMSTFRALAAGLLAALLLAVGATWIAARGLARRVGSYAAQAQAIAGGDYERPWPVAQVKELDSLATHLDRMSAAIRQRERERAMSDRLRVEEQLQQANLVVEHSPAMLFRWRADEGWPAVFVSDNVSQLGYSSAELLDGSIRFAALIHPDDLQRVGAEVQAFTEQGADRFRQEYRVVCRDGTIRWVDDRTAVERNAAGQVTHYLGVVIDVSESRNVEQALRESEARYRLLFDSNPHPMWVYDLDTLAFMTVNDAAVRKYGYSREQFLGLTVSDINLADDTPILPEDIVSVDEMGDAAGVWKHVTRDGTIIDVEIVAHAITYQGRPAQVVLAEDVTDRRRAEQALLESEVQYRELVENANSIILRWSPAGQINFINDFGLKFFGYSEDELFGQHVIGTIVPEFASGGQDLRAQMQDICRNPESFERNINENMRRGGERVWVSWTNRAVADAHGQVVEVFSVGSDITEHRRVDEELRQYREHLEELVAERTAELRQAMAQLVQTEKLAALGHLVAGVAHELNTPLGNARVVAGVLGEQFREFSEAIASGRLRRSQVDGLLSRGLEAVDLLERNTARAAELIGQFKEVAVDQSSARRRSFDLRKTVAAMLVTLRPGFKHTRHRIDLEIPAYLEMDSYPGPLEQVIANLVGNSLAHGFAGIDEGRIEIMAHTVAPDQVVLRYVDNGRGIPAEALNRVFEPFFTTGLGHGGSGLGLYIAYNLVTAVLGGSIAVDSPPGHGTRFTLTLPRSAPERVAGS